MVNNKKKQTVGKQPLKGKKAPVVRKKDSWFTPWIPLMVILPVVFLAFSPILDNGLTNWDDPDLIIDNPLIRTLSFDNLKTIFTTFYFGNYQPLHLAVYSVEYHFWQLNPAGYHAVSLFLFLIITSLVYYFIYLIGNRRILIAIIATALFAVNAMRVESVAWAAERKDMLYALFYVASLIAYVKYILSADESKGMPKIRYLVYALVFFVVSVFSKVMAVSLVGALVFLDYLYARRLTVWLVLEKIPFVIISIILGLVQVKAAASTHTIDTSGQFDFIDRMLIVCRNLMFYIYKMLLPLDLSAFHPYPVRLAGQAWPVEFYIAPAFALLILILFIWSLRKSRTMVFCIGFFISALALVLQFVAIGPALFNERYSLIPAIALSFALAMLVDRLIIRYPSAKPVLFGVTGIYFVFMFVLTFVRCNVWQTSLILWDDVLAQYPRASIALNNRGKIYGNELGNTTKALEDLSAAIASDPGYEGPYSNRGIIYCMNGKFDKAIADFNTALRIKPDYYESIANRAIAFAQTNKLDSALIDFTRCVELAPGKPTIYLNRGLCYYQMRQQEKAIADFNKGISLDPENGELYFRRSYSYHELGKHAEAFQDAQIAKNAGIKVEQAYFEKLKSLAGR
ncbi:MAG: tetratricopeptide repeat protein [Bacteroidota bacterium]